MTADRPAAPVRAPAIAVGVASLGAALAWTHFFSASIPFYFEDVELILTAIGRTPAELLLALVDPTAMDTRYGLFDRPVQLLALKSIHAIADFTPAVFHAFKSLCMLAVAGAIFAWIRRATGSLVFSAAAAIWLTTSHPIYQSTLWVVDFDVVAHVFTVLALALWSRQLSSRTSTPRAVLLESLAILVLAYVGSKTKGSALVVPSTIALSAAAFGARRFAHGLALAFAIAMLALAPRLADPAAVGAAIRWANAPELLDQVLRLVAFGPLGVAAVAGSLLWLASLLVRARLRDRASDARAADLDPRVRAAAAIALAWIASAAALWPLLPSSETRYLVGFLVPAIFAVCLAGGCALRMPWPRHRRLAFAGVLGVVIAGTIAHDTVLATHFRGHWGSRFIAIDRAMALVERSYERALVLYRYRRWVFYSPGSPRGNAFVLARAPALAHVLVAEPDGTLRVPPRFEHLLWVSFDGPLDGAREVARVDGRADTLFDRWIERLAIRPEEIDLMTLETRGRSSYPTTLHLYRRDLERDRALPVPSRPCVEGEGAAAERYFGVCLHASDVFGRSATAAGAGAR